MTLAYGLAIVTAQNFYRGSLNFALFDGTGMAALPALGLKQYNRAKLAPEYCPRGAKNPCWIATRSKSR